MQSNVQRLLPLLCVALLVGCANSPNLAIRDYTRDLKSIGVVSVAANSFSRQYIGVTVFGNEREQIDISSWGVNAEYEKQLGSAVEQVFNARVVLAPYPPQEFSRVNELNGPWNARAFWGPNWSAIEGAVRNHCSKTGVDAIVVAGRRKTDDIFGRTNQSVEGIGTYARGSTRYLHALVVVGLIDCKTAKPVAVSSLLGRSSYYKGNGTPAMEIPEEIARKKAHEWTSEDTQAMRQKVVLLPSETWAETLKKIQAGW